MLPAIHVTSTKESRDEQRIRYTVQRVEVDGSNTVIPSQHALFPADTTAVAVDARIYTLEVAVHDALFGFGTGSTVVLRRPDDSEVRYRLVHGKVTIPGSRAVSTSSGSWGRASAGGGRWSCRAIRPSGSRR